MRDYPMLILPLTPEDGGGWLALVPDLPGCMSDGETPAEAAENGRDALRCWVEAQQEAGWAVPAPGAFLAPLLSAALAGQKGEEARFLEGLLQGGTRLATGGAPTPRPLAVGSR